VNTAASLPSLNEANERVLHFQRKLHGWASSDAERRFCDLWNMRRSHDPMPSRYDLIYALSGQDDRTFSLPHAGY
jgi:hypothetical protein